MTGVAPLPGFAHNWVGGDIHGLSALAGQCYRIAPQISRAESALTTSAEDLTCTTWHGAAARAFTASWAKDSAAGRQLAGAWGQIGVIVDALAAELASLEHILEQAASEVEAGGVVIDPATGIPEPTVTAAGGKAAARIDGLLAEYGKLRSAILLQAKAARAAAAAGLQAIGTALLPPPARSGPLGSHGAGPLITGANTARSLWAVPTKFRLAAEKELPALEDNLQQAQRTAVQELMAARRLFGKGAAMPAGARDQLREATQEYNELQSKIDGAAGLESVSTKLAAGDAEGLGLPGSLGGAGDLAGAAVKAIPWLGSGAGVYLTIAGDLQRGESVVHATADAAGSTSAGVGTGIVVSSAASGVVDSSLLAAGAETGGVGILAMGAGDYVHHLMQEPWSQDWNKYGPVDGTLHALGDSASQTGSDIAGMPGAIVHEGEHLLGGMEHDIANFGEQLIP